MPAEDLAALDERALLDRFVRCYDRAIAGEVARRYAGLAYGTCHRLLDNAALAEDAAYAALKQVLLHPRSATCSLAGWVHRLAVGRSLELVRQLVTEGRPGGAAEQRRGAAWSDVAPLLDHALGELPEAELTRLLTAFVLPAPPPGASGAAARAIARLRARLAAKGLRIEADALAGLFAANGREPAPASLTATLAGFVDALPVHGAGPAATQRPLRQLLAGMALVTLAVAVVAGTAASALLRPPAPPTTTPAATPTVGPAVRSDTAGRLPLLFAAVMADDRAAVDHLLVDDPALARAWGAWPGWDRRPWTALHLATSVSRMAIIDRLLAAGADPLAARPENDQLTPLDTCENPGTGRSLLARLGHDGGVAWATASGDLAGLTRALNADPGLIAHRAGGGRTLLHVAVARGQADAALLLIARGAGLDAEDAFGCTPLRASFPADAGEAHARVRQDLIARGARWDLASACLAPRADIVDSLLAAEPGLIAMRSRVPGEEGRGALHAAAAGGDAAIVRRLAAAGGDPRQADEWGMTPLHCAAAAGRIEASRALLALGADPKATDQRRGATAEAWARRLGHIDTADAIAAWAWEKLPTPTVERGGNAF